MPLRSPTPPLFPTRRSSDLVGHARMARQHFLQTLDRVARTPRGRHRDHHRSAHLRRQVRRMHLAADDLGHVVAALDRKSTRLNSSHVAISYAVFCLKKTSTM